MHGCFPLPRKICQKSPHMVKVLLERHWILLKNSDYARQQKNNNNKNKVILKLCYHKGKDPSSFSPRLPFVTSSWAKQLHQCPSPVYCTQPNALVRRKTQSKTNGLRSLISKSTEEHTLACKSAQHAAGDIHIINNYSMIYPDPSPKHKRKIIRSKDIFLLY